MADHIYAAITADIVGSTEYYKTKGSPLRPQLLDALAQVNSSHSAVLAVPFGLTLGDEFQGLLSEPAKAPRVVCDLRLLLSPIRIRVGVGLGSIVSDMAATTAHMEGQAFSYAREAIEIAGRGKSGGTVYKADDRRVEKAANGMTVLIDAVQSRWTPKQWEAVRLYLRHKDLSSVGEQLGISPQGVEHRLRSTRWRDIERGVDVLADLITWFCHSAKTTTCSC